MVIRKILLFFFVLQACILADTFVPSGVVSDYLRSYTTSEILLIKKDLINIRSLILEGVASQKRPIYIATAGGPGSAKSTILESYIEEAKKEKKESFAYIDPEQQVLRFMVHTYLKSFSAYSMAHTPRYRDLSKQAYEKWKDGSNYISNTILNQAFGRHCNIAHGTSSTLPTISVLYKSLNEHGYHITIILCYATRNQRIKALRKRCDKQCFYQSTSDEIINKAYLFPKRFRTYFKYADKIEFYWTDFEKKKSTHAATWQRGEKIYIYNQKAFDQFKNQYKKEIRDRPCLSKFELLLKN